MTSQTKHYIELSDIVGLRGSCLHCGATVSLPLTAMRLDGLRSCHNCNEPWAMIAGSSIESTIKTFIDGFSKLEAAIGRVNEITTPSGGGFSLVLEIKPEAASTGSASGRASGGKG